MSDSDEEDYELKGITRDDLNEMAAAFFQIKLQEAHSASWERCVEIYYSVRTA
jgi:hypothetical protein